MQAMGVADVQNALDQLQLDIRILEFESATATAQQAADNIGCELGQIVKSLGFILSKTRPVLVLASGDQSVDERKLGAMFRVGRKQVRMMNAEQCLAILGYLPGGVPPIAHRRDEICSILDSSLGRYETVYAAGGAANAIFPIDLTTLQAVTRAAFADVVKS